MKTYNVDVEVVFLDVLTFPVQAESEDELEEAVANALTKQHVPWEDFTILDLEEVRVGA